MAFKRLSILLFSGVMAFSLISCGGDTTTNTDAGTESASNDFDTKEPTEEAEKPVIEMWSRGAETDTHAGPLINALKDFEEQNNVTVNYQFIPHSDVITKWNAAFASSTAPDVMDLGIVHIIERINLKHIAPLNEYVETWDAKDDIYPSMLKLGSFQDNVYAIAHFPDPHIFVYRKDMFEAAGLDPNTPPKSWDELLEYAEKLTIKDDSGQITQSGMAISTQNANQQADPMIKQLGSLFVDEEANVPLMTSPEAVQTLEFMSKLSKFSAPYDASKVDTNPILLDAAAMGYVPNAAISNYLRTNPDMADKFGFTACVPGEESATWCGVWFYSMTTQADDPALAWNLISHLTSKEVLKQRVDDAGLPSAFASSSEDYIELNPVMNQSIIDAITFGSGNPKVSWSSKYVQELNLAIEEVFYEQKTAEEALAVAQENLEKEINQ